MPDRNPITWADVYALHRILAWAGRGQKIRMLWHDVEREGIVRYISTWDGSRYVETSGDIRDEFVRVTLPTSELFVQVGEFVNLFAQGGAVELD